MSIAVTSANSHVLVAFKDLVFVNDLRFMEGSHGQTHGILNDLGWEIYPKGLYNIIMHITKQWNGMPIFITENGVADKFDKYRAQFIISHLQQVRLAIDEGANVIEVLNG